MNALYRGKRIGTGEWVYGFLFEMSEDCTPSTCIGVKPLAANDYGEIYRHCYFEVDPATVGQYTGLDDKNGVKIFEGDRVIVSAYSYTECEYEYSGEIFRAGLGLAIRNTFENGACERMYLLDIQGTCTTEYEVIGNIHDKEASE